MPKVVDIDSLKKMNREKRREFLLQKTKLQIFTKTNNLEQKYYRYDILSKQSHKNLKNWTPKDYEGKKNIGYLLKKASPRKTSFDFKINTG